MNHVDDLATDGRARVGCRLTRVFRAVRAPGTAALRGLPPEIGLGEPAPGPGALGVGQVYTQVSCQAPRSGAVVVSCAPWSLRSGRPALRRQRITHVCIAFSMSVTIRSTDGITRSSRESAEGSGT